MSLLIALVAAEGPFLIAVRVFFKPSGAVELELSGTLWCIISIAVYQWKVMVNTPVNRSSHMLTLLRAAHSLASDGE